MTDMHDPNACPIFQDVSALQPLSLAVTRAGGLGRRFRELRRDLNACQRCPTFENGGTRSRCETLENFNSLVRECLLEIQAEWEREE